MLKTDRLLLVVGVVMMVVGTSLSAHAAGDQLFAGVWAKSCTPEDLEGITYIFHDGDRLKIVDLDCGIRGWKRTGNHYSSGLLCTLDGVRQRAHIGVVRVGERLRITLGGKTETVQSCP